MRVEIPVRRLASRPQLGKVCHVIRVGAKDRFTVICCSIAAEWFLGHWDGRRTVRCTGDESTCEGHQKQWPERAKGYITVCQPDKLVPMLLELTPAAGEDLEERMFPHSESMRGSLMFVSRLRESMNSQLMITRLEKFHDIRLLPESVNPEPTVNRLWPFKKN